MVEENVENYTDFPGKCDYCHGIGACPKCWGRAAITVLELEKKQKQLCIDDYRRQLNEQIRDKHRILDEYHQKLLVEIERVKQLNNMTKCGTCGGVPHSSGVKCICNGSNTVWGEVHGLRTELWKSNKKFELAKALERQRPMCPDHRDKFSHVNCIACFHEEKSCNKAVVAFSKTVKVEELGMGRKTYHVMQDGLNKFLHHHNVMDAILEDKDAKPQDH